MKDHPQHKVVNKIPHNVSILAWTSFFQNVSSVIVSSLSPIMLQSLGADIRYLGIIRGSSEALSNALKLFSGYVSDRIKNRKFIVVLGYFWAILTKFLFASAGSIGMYATAQTVDRIANGLRDTPRDTMLLESCYQENYNINKAIALRQILANIGSVLGGILCMIFIGSRCSLGHARSLYLWTSIPVLIAFILVLFSRNTTGSIEKANISDIFSFPRSYWKLVFSIAVVMLSRFSESLLGGYALNHLELSTVYQPAILVVYYLSSFYSSWIVSRLASSIALNKLFSATCLAVSIGYIALSLVQRSHTKLDFILFWLGVTCCGIYTGAASSLSLMAISKIIPKRTSIYGTAIGIFGVVNGFSMFFSSSIFGYLASTIGYSACFFYFSIFSIITAFLVLISITRS